MVKLSAFVRLVDEGYCETKGLRNVDGGDRKSDWLGSNEMRLIFNRRGEGATLRLGINFISRQIGQRAETAAGHRGWDWRSNWDHVAVIRYTATTRSAAAAVDTTAQCGGVRHLPQPLCALRYADKLCFLSAYGNHSNFKLRSNSLHNYVTVYRCCFVRTQQ